MRAIVIFLVFVTANYVSSVPCVAPSTWEATFEAHDHLTGYYARGRMAYDKTGEKVRTVEAIKGNATVAYDSLYLFNKHAHYRVDLKTKKCSKEALNFKFEPIEIHANSTYLGEVIIGSLNGIGTGVIVQSWAHKSSSGGQVFQTFTSHDCIPVSHSYYGKNSAGKDMHYHFDYYDVRPGVSSPEIFDVPKSCM
ncbi:ependymin-like [Clavelina lepadiformis]|uniref:ependymin-like n=1 Tax=Clavelina lepadiformis TaxID=159417 RepID=UPI0040419F3D